MIFCLYTDYGAQNSKPVFEAFAQSILDAGHEVIYNEPYRVGDHYSNYDVAVIWSVLWHGRMAKNKDVWDQNRLLGRPVVVLEVGGINRGTTWKVGLNGINRDAYFGEQDNDRSRADSLGLVCKPWRSNGDFILICGQHDKSLQWQNMLPMSNWFLETYDEIRKHTERPIIFRPHPRCRLEHIERGLKNVHRQEPVKIGGSYDDFDMGFDNVHCTISYSSNPGIHSILSGVPAFVSTHSLAYPVGNDIDFLHDIENPAMPDRQQWLNDYVHTEHPLHEIASGIPLRYLLDQITS